MLYGIVVVVIYMSENTIRAKISLKHRCAFLRASSSSFAIYEYSIGSIAPLMPMANKTLYSGLIVMRVFGCWWPSGLRMVRAYVCTCVCVCLPLYKQVGWVFFCQRHERAMRRENARTRPSKRRCKFDYREQS